MFMNDYYNDLLGKMKINKRSERDRVRIENTKNV